MSSAPPADDDAVEHIDTENTALRSGVRLNEGGGIASPALWQRPSVALRMIEDAVSLTSHSSSPMHASAGAAQQLLAAMGGNNPAVLEAMQVGHRHPLNVTYPRSPACN